MYYVVSYKQKLLGIFTTFINAKSYIDNNFKFDFIDNEKAYCSIQHYIDYYSDWNIKMAKKVYKHRSMIQAICDFKDIKRIDNLYIINNKVLKENIDIKEECEKINKTLVEITENEIKYIEYILNTELDSDIEVLIDEINNKKNIVCDR